MSTEVQNGSAISPLANDELKQAEIGIVGMGAMGAGIAACVLVAGQYVRAVEPLIDSETVRQRVVQHLENINVEHRPQSIEEMMQRLTVSSDYADLKSCTVVNESVVENLEVKREVIRLIEEQVADTALVGTNTSALPITQVQQEARLPERVLGIHWGLPPLLPLMEIIKGNQTSDETMTRAVQFARFWGKDPTVVRKDIRGFVVNRLSYAMFREAAYLLDNGVASPEDIDRASRYGIGIWGPFEGPFGEGDYNLELFITVLRDLLPDLSCNTEVPAFLERMLSTGERSLYKGEALTPEGEKRNLEVIIKRAQERLAQLEAAERGGAH